jgi:negative regulator of sigma E activity
VSFPQTAAIVNVQCLSAPVATGVTPGAGVVNTAPTQTCAQYRYSNVTSPNEAIVTRQSLYQIRVGVRFEF